MGIYANAQDNDDIIRRCKEKIKKIGMSWGYEYPFIARINKENNKLDKFWIEFYVCKTMPPKKIREEIKSIKELDKYGVSYVCSENGQNLSEASIKLLRHIELMDINIKSLRSKKKQQRGFRK